MNKKVHTIGIVTIVAGIILVIAGAFTYVMVHNELRDEKITVSADAARFGGRQVKGPLTAYAEAEVINKHAMEASGGKTYAELEQTDPKRQTVMTASFLRASLFTSVVAFGLSLLVIGLGALFILVGWALMSLSERPPSPEVASSVAVPISIPIT